MRDSTWTPVLTSEADFTRLQAEKAFIGPERKYEGGSLALRDFAALRIPVEAKDAILRAKVKHGVGRNVFLTLRASLAPKHDRPPADSRFDNGIVAWFNGGEFGFGAQRNGVWQVLHTAFAPQPIDGYFEFAVAAVGPKVAIFVEGRKIFEVDDADPKRGHMLLGVSESSGFFRDIEYQLLDQRPRPMPK